MKLKKTGKSIATIALEGILVVGIIIASGINVGALSNYSLSDFKYKYDKENENGLELIECKTKEARKLISPLGKYNLWGKYIFDENNNHVTKIRDDFSFIEEEKIVETIKVNNARGETIWIGAASLLFDRDTTITYYKDIYADIREIDLPRCKSVGDNGLFSVENLISAKMPMCSKIGENGFSNCGKLESVEISKEYTKVLDGTFEKCYKLNNFNNWENIEVIGQGAFHGTNFENIVVPNCNNIDSRAFLDCKKLKSFTANKGYTNIKAETFKGCSLLNEFSNFENIEKIEERGFSQTAFEKIELPNCIEIGEESFEGCGNLESIDLPNCEKLGVRAFSRCNKLREVNIPKCKEIGDLCFGYYYNTCDSLRVFNAPECTKLGNGVFRGCENLEEVNIPKCKNIDDLEFIFCENLKSVNMPICESVGYSAFYRCLNLEELYLPMCKKISENAFGLCPSLKKIVVAKGCVFEEGAIEEGVKVEYIGDDKTKEVLEYDEIKELMVSPTDKKTEEEEAFFEKDDETGIIVSAEAGVVPQGVHMVVKKLKPGDIEEMANSNDENFEQAIKNIDDDKLKKMENLDMYTIELRDSDNNEIELTKDVVVMFPIVKNYSIKELEVLRVTPTDDVAYEPDIVEINGEKYCAINTNHFSIYCVYDMYTVADCIRAYAPYVIATLGAIMLTVLALPRICKNKYHN